MSKPFMRKLNPFKPTDIGGCQLWLDAADRSTFTLSGLNILQWNDKSGLGRNATVVGTIPLSSSINGISTPRYSLNTNTYFSGTSINTGSTLSAFAVYVQNNNSTANNRIVSLGTIGTLDWNNISSISAILMLGTNFVSYRNSSQLGSIAGTFGVPSLSSSISTGQFNTFYLNGRAGTTVASSGNFNYSTYFIGSTVGEQNFTALSGTIGEVLLYNTALTDPQRQQIEGYLAQKWGLQPNLPAGSPGRTQVIYPRSPLIDGLTTGQPTRLPFLRSSRATLQTRTFTYTGTFQPFTIPATISPTTVTVYMWGAGGGGGYVSGSFTPGAGGAGAMIQGTFSVSPGQTLYIVVGGGGSFGNVNNQTDAQGGGGKAYYDVNASLWGAGSGGGRSAIQLSEGGSDFIVVGGGGGGAVTRSAITNGGSATFSGTANGGTGSTGGTQISGGTPGTNGETGSKKFGGAGWLPGNYGGGGGGGGYWGGGGGGIENGYGSGGGGSSYTDNLSAVVGYNSANGVAAPNTISQYYQSGIAVGGPPSFIGGTPGTINLGGNGLVVLVYSS